MSFAELGTAKERTDLFLAGWTESPLWCNQASLEVLRDNRALISASEPMMPGNLEIWWRPELLVLDAKEDPDGDELVMLILAQTGRWLKLTVNGGSAIPFDMMSVEELA